MLFNRRNGAALLGKVEQRLNREPVQPKKAANVRRENLTKELIASLEPAPRRYDVGDDGPRRERGLVVTVHPSGMKSWYVVWKVAGRVERYHIATCADLPPEKARKKAAWFRAECAEGRNPAEAKRGRRAEATLAEVWEAWLAHHENPTAGRKSIAHDKWRYEKHLAGLAGRRLSEIGRADVAKLHASITAGSGPVAANRACALLSSLYGWWGQRIGLEIANPCRRPRGQRGPGWNKETPRERYLLPDELRRWWAAVLADRDTDARELAALLLLTGARRGNLQAARWEQVDLGARCWRIPAPEMKANREHEAPLSVAAAGILADRHKRAGEPAEGWVFPGRGADGPLGDPRGGLSRIAKAAKVNGLRPHDLRRSFATLALDPGVDSAVIRHLLGHSDASVTAIYRKVTFPTALAAAERAGTAIVRGGGLEPADFAGGLPTPAAIRPEQPVSVLAFPAARNVVLR